VVGLRTRILYPPCTACNGYAADMASRRNALAALLLFVSMSATARPGLEEVRKDMGAASSGDVRGQRDTVGYAATREAMAKVWELSAQGPAPQPFGAA
jgi:hypothetical protein